MIRKIFFMFMVPAVIMLFVISCYKEDGIIDNGVTDVSNRITSLPENIGANDTMLIAGTELESFQRIIFGPVVITPNDVAFTSEGIKFVVPTLVPNGMNDFIIIFPGNLKAFDSINVTANPIVNWFQPVYGTIGDTVTVYGSNLFVVNRVTIGGIEAEILSKPGQLLTLVIPESAVTDYISLESVTITARTVRQYIVCDGSDEYVCMPNLILDGSGAFELGTVGEVEADADVGPGWYCAGMGGANARQFIEIMNVSDLPPAIANFHGLDSLVAKVTLNSNFLNTELTDDWQIQMVNTVDPLDTARQFVALAKIWSDMTGRQIKIYGGTSRPGYSDMEPANTVTLNAGWNEIETEPFHHVAGQDDDHVRVQMSYGYQINDGVIFYFDDIRLIDAGPWSAE